MCLASRWYWMHAAAVTGSAWNCHLPACYWQAITLVLFELTYIFWLGRWCCRCSVDVFYSCSDVCCVQHAGKRSLNWLSSWQSQWCAGTLRHSRESTAAVNCCCYFTDEWQLKWQNHLVLRPHCMHCIDVFYCYTYHTFSWNKKLVCLGRWVLLVIIHYLCTVVSWFMPRKILLHLFDFVEIVIIAGIIFLFVLLRGFIVNVMCFAAS